MRRGRPRPNPFRVGSVTIPRALRRSARYSRGEQALWFGGTAARLAALGVLAWRLPRSVPTMGLARIGSAIVVGMVLLTTL